MNDLVLIGMLVLVGAIIGGGTNVIAIRMLFRPYNSHYIGPVKLPFTPGLIPKRKADIAESLGKTVEDHLVTPEGIQERLKDGLLLKEVENRLSNATHDLLQNDLTLDEWLDLHLEKKDQMKNIRQSIESGLETRLLQWIGKYKDLPVEEWLPDDWKELVEEKIPVVADNVLRKTTEHLHSDDGKAQIEEMVSRFFTSKGSISSMVGRMASRFSLSNALSNELVRFLKEKHTKKLLIDLLQKEWKQTISNSPAHYLREEAIEERVRFLAKAVIAETPLVGEWEKPIQAWGYRYEQVVQNVIIPSIMATAATVLSRYIKAMIKKIGIREIVTNEVNNFPLERLEEILLTIARRELKMIALLGAFIGGLVGLIQGIIIVFFI